LKEGLVDVNMGFIRVCTTDCGNSDDEAFFEIGVTEETEFNSLQIEFSVLAAAAAFKELGTLDLAPLSQITVVRWGVAVLC
jgi:hypothetical protein